MYSTGFFWMAATMPVLVLSKELWSTQPAGQDGQYILKTGYPVGNGKLGAIPFGPPGVEKVNINIDSLWSGGPFESNDYRGGNPATPKDQFLPEIRAGIFSNGTGDMNQLLGSGDSFGSNRVVANLTVSIAGIETYEKYHRSLDLSNGVHTTYFATGDLGKKVESKVFCSYPDQVCVYHIESEENLPAVRLGFENSLVASDLYSTKCQNGLLHHNGVTQKGPPEGMKYIVIAGFNPKQGTPSCLDSGELHIAPTGRKLTIMWSADTNYDQKNGNAEAGFSFKGEDPAARVSQLVDDAIDAGFCALSKRHTDDFEGLSGAFSLQLPDTQDSGSSETSSLVDGYNSKGPGDPFIDGLLFDLSRYLLISSSRQNSLPANLQGRWTEQLWPAWSADYHSNINIQMNYWIADQTGLANTQKALWNYFEDTWVPRGSQTAKLLYGAKGWVVHNEMNIFGFTAMKSVASWANYPVAPAWMMQHVWDAFEYTQDVDWFKKQGYPLIKGVAEFWLSSLQEDQYFNDGSLVAVPCNSAEHGPTTFGCTHYQQLIHQVFDSVLAAASIVSEQDGRFLDDVKSSLARLDKGLHFTSWGGIREWKVSESAGVDERSDHRHLSHLNGWYPGYSIASFADGYTNKTIQDAVREALVARGMGNAGDGNAGWAKVWRSACWARLNETERAYDQLKYAIQENFAGNGFSMYSGRNPPFQIDANFGFGGAVLSMLVVDIPLAHDAASQRTVVVGPAIPKQWANGSVRGLRLRGGGRIDFTWNREGLVEMVKVVQSSKVKGSVQLVNARGANLGLI